jgi:hypothetical protein
MEKLAALLEGKLEEVDVTRITRMLERGGAQENRALGILFEANARNVFEEAGETVIRSQRVQGAVDRGFDFLTVEGKGAEAKLFINEAKGVNGEVVAGDFSPFGLGKNAANGGQNTLDKSIEFATEAIRNAEIDDVTKRALLQQLRDKTASVRIIGRDTTVVSQEVMDQITAKSGFKVIPEVKKLP